MGLVKTTGKEYYYFVSGLMVPKYKVSSMLTEKIEYFVDWASKNANKLEPYSYSNMKLFIQEMDTLYMMLCSIYAHWLEMEAARILRLAEIDEGELCQNLVVPFTTNLQTLAIDIQMAQNKGFENSYRQRTEIERYRGVISSMKVIDTLLESSDFEKAFDIAISVNELHESEYFLPFIASITSKSINRAAKMTSEIIAVYTKKIDDIISAATETIVLKKIVIVDDIPEVLTALDFMLKEHYQVFTFTEGQDALNFVDSKLQPDAFLLDIEMPGMDGFTLAKRIRSRIKHETTPILFLTGDSRQETLMRSVLYGAKAFIVKPANKDIIISKLSSCLK